ncbi:S-adenosyl-L-methionine-dependent methyltransferase [Pleurostoma richardsiae]|uniref:S-adenosyl-L-methionine-dependent methyltransferase n=1 Tax=Pleurostoma richardsiae TaxID=41990 RepID=A0AA38VYB7_9PEZI|nr:S-adenosyl-L-methionine-dependent methyltransferase [Pleurostoma richardsiae]
MSTATTAAAAAPPRALPAAAADGFADAAAYDAHRPSYPPAAVDAFLSRLSLTAPSAPAGQGRRVVEVAAGTGKFTEVLAARPEGFEVLAVEPHEGMRAELRRKGLAGVQVREGFAAEMPVESGWGDGAVAAQAWHWFANEESLAEIHRVLKPGAKFGMIWNVEDYNKPASWKATTSWEKLLNEWIFERDDGLPRFRDEQWRAVFARQKDSPSPLFSAPPAEERVPWTVWLSEDALWARFNTLSQVAVLKGEERAAAERTFREAMAMEDVERNERGEVAVHGVTFFAWTERL